ncbi:MAG TPA: tetratricopeptide repeat protein [Chthoniobacterales bacterium]|jgi:tetratricopeptide (TPR) repeat protein|nr:tetratricopeptide repeat protein [Chthoniobacterales bacterium]
MAKANVSAETSQKTWLLGLLLLVATALAYLPAWHGAPIWDDNAHITNPGLRSLQGLVLIWTRPGATQQYYPLVHTVFWIEQKLWGDASLGYHLVNILLHACSALVLFRILRRLKIPGAFLAAGLFALHPVQVESVAWISELKNTLSGLFFFLSIFNYLKFDETRNRRAYIAALVLFFCGLLCKTVIAPLPAVVLVLLWWKRGSLRARKDIAPTIPFFALGILAGLFTALVERNLVGAQGPEFQLSILQRFLIAARDFWFYLFKLIWPAKLTFIYPRWQISGAVWWQYIFLVALIALFAFAWFLRRKNRGPLAASLIFLGLLFPALGFINVYPFLYSFVADHFQYLACVAPLTFFAAGITRALESFRRWTLGAELWTFAPAKTFLRPAIYGALFLVLGILTWRQSRDYRDIETLWRTTLARNPDCWMAYSNLGSFLAERGRLNEAITDFRKALSLWPNQSKDHNNLGKALVETGRLDEAMDEFQAAEKISPDDPDTENNIGAAYLKNGRIDNAIEHLLKAVRKGGPHPDAYINLGNAYLRKRDFDKAIAAYSESLALPIDHAEAHYSIANAFRQKGNVDDAILHYRLALQLRANYGDAHNNLGNALRQKGQIEEAIREYELALQIQSDSLTALNNLAWLLATATESRLRNGAKAVELSEQTVVATDGRDPIMLHTLAAAYAEKGEFDKAVAAAEDALKIADASGVTSLSESLRSKLALYRSSQPYHEPAPSH